MWSMSRFHVTLAVIVSIGAAHSVIAQSDARTTVAPPKIESAPAAQNNGAWSPYPVGQADTSKDAATNELRFESGSDRISQHAREMAEKLNDPVKRARLREEQRGAVVRSHPDVGRQLGLDRALESRLIELLTDQTMKRLEEMFVREQRKDAFDESMQQSADAHTRAVEEQRALLGEEGWRRFDEYRASAGERMQVAYFEQRLPAQEKLSDQAHERMIMVLRQHRDAEIARMQDPERSIPSLAPSDLRDPTATSRMMARANYRSLRSMEEASARVQEQLKQVLTERQLREYAQMEAKKLAAQRHHVEQLLEQAGLRESELEEPAATLAPARKPVAGQLTFNLGVHVDGVETNIAQVAVMNGSGAEVQIAEDLVMQATPTLFDDGWLNLKLKFFEGTGANRRALPGETGTGHLLGLPDGTRSDSAVASTVVLGRKGYAVLVRLTKVKGEG
jgi:hypothetical protein